MKKLPKLPKAEGTDIQYRLQLMALAQGFSRVLGKAKPWEIHKKQIAYEAIYNIYKALA